MEETFSLFLSDRSAWVMGAILQSFVVFELDLSVGLYLDPRGIIAG